MSSLDCLDLCRLCLVKDSVSVPIFGGEGDARQIFLKIAACLPVKVARDDKLPKKICDQCVCKIELCYEFWNTTVNSEKQLIEWLGGSGVEDKQNYVSDVLNPNIMKQEQSNENRLDGTVMQVSGHQSNMAIGMMGNLALNMPIIISTSSQQQISSVPMDTSCNSVQAAQPLPGPSSQTSHSQNQVNSVGQEEEESTEEDDNTDDDGDAEEGLPVKEESEEDVNTNRSIEPTTFVNVSLACDEAGPSGLQQQKISEMPEMTISQTTDGDPKSGEENNEAKILNADSFGRIIIGKNAVPMKLCQRVDINGSISYALIPAEISVLKNKISLSPVSSIKVELNNENIQKSNQIMNLYTEIPLSLCKDFINYYICEKCGIKFPTESMLNRHKMSHNFKHCLRKRLFEEKRSHRKLEKRYKILKDNYDYSCKFCNFSCKRKTILKAHLSKKHEIEDDSLSKLKDDCKNVNESIKFKCDFCNFECKRNGTLTSHIVRYHRKSNIIENTNNTKTSAKIDNCDTTENYSDMKSSRKTNALYKKRTVNPNQKHDMKIEDEYCDLCEFKCSKKSTLYSHKRRHKLDNVNEVFSCNECGFKTCKKASLYSHIKRKHKAAKSSVGDEQPELFYCNQCDYKNKNKYELKIHVVRKHTDDFKFSCETCGKKFKVKGDLTNHIRFTHREQPVICDVCGKTCLNSNSLYVHQKFAHYKAKYECQICKRRMVSQENLNEHMLRQHERRENVVCEECGKTFSRNSRLKVHMRVHTGDKPYTCTICNKAFARRTALKQHLLIHTGIRPYVCDICGKAFTQKPGLISHRKSHPGSHPPLPRVLIDHILNDVMNA